MFKGGIGEGSAEWGRWWGCWNPLSTRNFNDWELEDVERLLSWSWEKKEVVERDDTVWWIETKSGVLQGLRVQTIHFFPHKEYLEELCTIKTMLLCLRSNLGTDSNLRLVAEKRLFPCNHRFFYVKCEEIVDHLSSPLCKYKGALWDALHPF